MKERVEDKVEEKQLDPPRPRWRLDKRGLTTITLKPATRAQLERVRLAINPRATLDEAVGLLLKNYFFIGPVKEEEARP